MSKHLNRKLIYSLTSVDENSLKPRIIILQSENASLSLKKKILIVKIRILFYELLRIRRLKILWRRPFWYFTWFVLHNKERRWAFLVAQMVNNLTASWQTWVWTLGQEDPLEKELATHSSILAWKIPWTEEPGRLQSIESQRVRHDRALAWWTTYSNSISFFSFVKYKETNLLKVM